MKCKYQCPYCQYMSLKKWNIERHVKNIHGMKNFPNGNCVKPNIKHQNMRQPEFCTKCECPDHSSEYRSIQQHQQTFDDEQRSSNGSNQFQRHYITYDETKSRDEIFQEKHPPLMKTIACHQLVSDEYEYDQMPYDATKSRDESCKKRKPIVINSKGVFILE